MMDEPAAVPLAVVYKIPPTTHNASSSLTVLFTHGVTELRDPPAPSLSRQGCDRYLKANGVNRADPDVQRRVKILKPEVKAAGKRRTKIKEVKVAHFNARVSRRAKEAPALGDDDIEEVFNMKRPPKPPAADKRKKRPAPRQESAKGKRRRSSESRGRGPTDADAATPPGGAAAGPSTGLSGSGLPVAAAMPAPVAPPHTRIFRQLLRVSPSRRVFTLPPPCVARHRSHARGSRTSSNACSGLVPAPR